MKVMLVDDHPLVRNGIASLLRAWGYDVVAEANDGREAIDMAMQATPDVIFMDIRMPRMGGLEATRLIKARRPETKIVMLTVSDDEQDLFEAVKSGAQGYILKDLEATDFYEAIKLIERGEAILPSRLAGNLLAEFRTQAECVGEEPEANPLTTREQEILSLVAEGLTNKESGERLYISENTVKFHMKNILEKLHLQNRAQVIAWAARRDIGQATNS